MCCLTFGKTEVSANFLLPACSVKNLDFLFEPDEKYALLELRVTLQLQLYSETVKITANAPQYYKISFVQELDIVF